MKTAPHYSNCRQAQRTDEARRRRRKTRELERGSKTARNHTRDQEQAELRLSRTSEAPRVRIIEVSLSLILPAPAPLQPVAFPRARLLRPACRRPSPAAPPRGEPHGPRAQAGNRATAHLWHPSPEHSAWFRYESAPHGGHAGAPPAQRRAGSPSPLQRRRSGAGRVMLPANASDAAHAFALAPPPREESLPPRAAPHAAAHADRAHAFLSAKADLAAKVDLSAKVDERPLPRVHHHRVLPAPAARARASPAPPGRPRLCAARPAHAAVVAAVRGGAAGQRAGAPAAHRAIRQPAAAVGAFRSQPAAAEAPAARAAARGSGVACAVPRSDSGSGGSPRGAGGGAPAPAPKQHGAARFGRKSRWASLSVPDFYVTALLRAERSDPAAQAFRAAADAPHEAAESGPPPLEPFRPSSARPGTATASLAYFAPPGAGCADVRGVRAALHQRRAPRAALPLRDAPVPPRAAGRLLLARAPRGAVRSSTCSTAGSSETPGTRSHGTTRRTLPRPRPPRLMRRPPRAGPRPPRASSAASSSMSAPPERLRASCARSLSQTRPGVPRPAARPCRGGAECARGVASGLCAATRRSRRARCCPRGGSWCSSNRNAARRSSRGRRAKAARVGAKIAAAEAEAAARRAAAARDREALEYSLRRRQQQQGRGGAGGAAAAAAAGGGADENESEQYAQQCRALNILPPPRARLAASARRVRHEALRCRRRRRAGAGLWRRRNARNPRDGPVRQPHRRARGRRARCGAAAGRGRGGARPRCQRGRARRRRRPRCRPPRPPRPPASSTSPPIASATQTSRSPPRPRPAPAPPRPAPPRPAENGSNVRPHQKGPHGTDGERLQRPAPPERAPRHRCERLQRARSRRRWWWGCGRRRRCCGSTSRTTGSPPQAPPPSPSSCRCLRRPRRALPQSRDALAPRSRYAPPPRRTRSRWRPSPSPGTPFAVPPLSSAGGGAIEPRARRRSDPRGAGGQGAGARCSGRPWRRTARCARSRSRGMASGGARSTTGRASLSATPPSPTSTLPTTVLLPPPAPCANFSGAAGLTGRRVAGLCERNAVVVAENVRANRSLTVLRLSQNPLGPPAPSSSSSSWT